MQIESPHFLITKPLDETIEFLSQLKNYEQLMPENCEKFEIDGESFKFGLKGMPEIRMVIKEVQESAVVLGAASSKLPFTLSANLSSNGDQTNGHFLFDGEINPMMAMMIKKPLTQFLEGLANQLKSL